MTFPLVLIICGGILLVLLAVLVALRRLFRRRAEEIRRRFPHARLVVPGANFFGQESRGAAQARGNGTLVLTDTELFFEQILPRREFHVPLAEIHAVETARSHLGKTVGRPLVKVVFRTGSGQLDSIAWSVPRHDEVMRALSATGSGRGEP